jgi:NADH dehydrogenase [ubiquinone] 1 alpha subcomplex assembly factor 7
VSDQLLDLIRRRIAAEGPMPVSEFMATALGHPEHGYYMTQTAIGAAGDFITAPEISQMFGELLGLWCVSVWQTMGEPAFVNLVELGPGRGTLLADAMRAVKVQPKFCEAAKIRLVESSPRLRQEQQRKLADIPATWHDSFAGVPQGPSLLLANEFFDALPVRQFQHTDRGWCERMVVLDGEGLKLALSPEPVPVTLLPRGVRQASKGAVAEISPLSETIMSQIGERLALEGGAALVIDYGHEGDGTGDTLQAVRRHAFADVLDCPGSADLTAHVDFRRLADAASSAGACVYGPIGQGVFLERLGISVRAQHLAAAADAKQAADIASAHRRLTEPSAMGTLFKVMAATSPSLPAPAGFEGDPT